MVSNDFKKKAERRLRKKQHSDLILNRLMIVFVLSVVAITVLLALNNGISRMVFLHRTLLPILLVVSGIGFVGAVVLAILRNRKKFDDSERILTKWNILGTAVVFLLTVVLSIYSHNASVPVLFVIEATVLYFVYHIFTKDFFLCSCVTAAGTLLLRMVTQNVSSKTAMIAGIAVGVAALVGFVLGFMILGGKGKLVCGGRELVTKGKAYPLFVIAAIMAIGTALSFVMVSFVIYALILLLAAYLVLAVVYIIRMM